MSRPAAIAWYRNAEWIARRTGSFPRNEKLRFDTPPLTLHAGAAPLDLAGRLDERLRVLVVLLEPGRDRQDVRVDDDVGRVVAGLVRSAADTARSPISILRSTVPACPCSSKHITTTAAP